MEPETIISSIINNITSDLEINWMGGSEDNTNNEEMVEYNTSREDNNSSEEDDGSISENTLEIMPSLPNLTNQRNNTVYPQHISTYDTSNTIITRLKQRSTFIPSNNNNKQMVGMYYFWGPYGPGYYPLSSLKFKPLYTTKINIFNNLNIEKKKIILSFLSKIKLWSQKELLGFYELLGLRKIPFVNLVDIVITILHNTCPICFIILFPNNLKKKCISSKCSGMCEKCQQCIKDICPVCNTKQELTCPVCLETRPLWAIKKLNCHHGICWACWARVLEEKHHLTLCPQCRRAI